MRCPGQDTRYWKAGDIFEVLCPKCDRKVEFFKDESRRTCRCGQEVINPKLDFGCAQWCQYAEQCVGVKPSAAKEKSPEDSILLSHKG